MVLLFLGGPCVVTATAYLLRWNLRYLRMLLVGMKVQDMQARIFQMQRSLEPPGCGGRVLCLIS